MKKNRNKSYLFSLLLLLISILTLTGCEREPFNLDYTNDSENIVAIQFYYYDNMENLLASPTLLYEIEEVEEIEVFLEELKMLVYREQGINPVSDRIHGYGIHIVYADSTVRKIDEYYIGLYNEDDKAIEVEFAWTEEEIFNELLENYIDVDESR